MLYIRKTYEIIPYMNLNQLRVFFETARHLNFSRAAEHLSISQPAVSAQVKQLEEALSLKLFNKAGKRIFLTEAGKALLEYAQKIFEAEAEAEKTLREMKELRRGALHIGTTKTYARYLMPNYISAFHAKYPEVSIYLNEGSSMEMIHSLFHIKNDLAIVASTTFPKSLQNISFGQEEILLVASPDHPLALTGSVTVELLASTPIIMREEGSGTRRVVLDMFRSRNLFPTILYEASNLEFIKTLVTGGEGVSFIVRPAVERELSLGTLREIKITDAQLVMDCNVVYLRGRTLSRAADAFLAVLFENRKNG
jgi:DNA-binding transcriptional LysR family regulator